MTRPRRGQAEAEGEAEAGAVVVDTVLGPCVLVWTGRGVRELHLPDPGETLRKAASLPAGARAGAPGGAGRTAPGGAAAEGAAVEAAAPPIRPLSSPAQAPAWVRALVRRIRRHLEGHFDAFEDVPLDLPESAGAFDRAVWDAARQVPPGLTITYGELAEEAGRPGAARACGSALRRCPVSLIIPAHRVVAAGRRPGGWTGPGGVTTKLRLLALEGVELARPR